MLITTSASSVSIAVISTRSRSLTNRYKCACEDQQENDWPKLHAGHRAYRAGARMHRAITGRRYTRRLEMKH